jgi:hypothetical protein
MTDRDQERIFQERTLKNQTIKSWKNEKASKHQKQYADEVKTKVLTFLTTMPTVD